MQLTVSSFTCTGRRTSNQDHLLAATYDNSCFLQGLVIVADGMGGAASGHTASRIAAEAFGTISTLSEISNSIPDLIKQYALDAHQAIMEAIEKNPAFTGMGTTLVAALAFQNAPIFILNAGDSRAYLVKNGADAQLITKDHKAFTTEDLRKMLDEKGDFALARAYSKAISSCLGADGSEPLLDIFELGEVEDLAGSAILVCSDGLVDNGHDIFGENEELLARTITEYVFGMKSGEECCRNLAGFAYNEGSTDNISLCLMEFGDLLREKKNIDIFPLPTETAIQLDASYPDCQSIKKLPNTSLALLCAGTAVIAILLLLFLWWD